MIAFTAESLPKLFYAGQARLGNGSLVGYTNFSLAYAPFGSVQYAPLYEQQFQGVVCRYGEGLTVLLESRCSTVELTLCGPQIQGPARPARHAHHILLAAARRAPRVRAPVRGACCSRLLVAYTSRARECVRSTWCSSSRSCSTFSSLTCRRRSS